MKSADLLKAKYAKANYHSLNNRLQVLKPILIKRKSAFTIYEWMKINELIRITE